MKKSRAQQAADAAFIEKLKSINIGGKPLGEHTCPGCGDKVADHHIEVKVVPIPAGFFMKEALARRQAMNN